MESLAIIVSDDSYDKMLCPLVFAYVQSAEGTQVDIFFVSWAVRVLTDAGARAIRINGHHAAEDQRIREKVAEMGMPADLIEFLKVLKATENVGLYGCDMAAKIYEVGDDDLIAEADGIVGAGWFLNEIAVKADHCAYF